MTGEKKELVPGGDSSVGSKIMLPVNTDRNLAENLIAKAIEKGVPLETMEKLLAMRKELRMEYAKSEFDKAMSGFQSECPVIGKSKKVLNKDKQSTRYHYAPLDEIVKQTKTLLEKFGFSYMFEVINDEKGVEAKCIANHKEGFSKESSFRAPIDPEAFMNGPQKFASALTFAKRYAFCDVFGIMTGDEDDDTQAVTESDAGEKKTDVVLKAIAISDEKNLEDFKIKLSKSDKYTETAKRMFIGAINSRLKTLKESNAASKVVPAIVANS
jgi:hypothetical protein